MRRHPGVPGPIPGGPAFPKTEPAYLLLVVLDPWKICSLPQAGSFHKTHNTLPFSRASTRAFFGFSYRYATSRLLSWTCAPSKHAISKFLQQVRGALKHTSYDYNHIFPCQRTPKSNVPNKKTIQTMKYHANMNRVKPVNHPAKNSTRNRMFQVWAENPLSCNVYWEFIMF